MAHSNAERAFKAKYPFARHTVDKSGPFERYTVYAGDYLCSEYVTRAGAYKLALTYERQGFIQPCPHERSTTVGHPS